MRIATLIFVTAVGAAVCSGVEPSSLPSSTARVTMQELIDGLATAQPGDTVQTPFGDLASFKPVAVTIRPLPDKPQLLLADQPEYFRTGNGISMQEEVKPGAVRLYLYHVPEPGDAPKVISAVIENSGDVPMTITFQRYASPEPGGDYHKVATTAMKAFLKRQPAPDAIRSRTVAPKQRIVVDPAIDARPVTKDILVHVFHEFVIDQPARITVFQRDPQADSVSVIDTLAKLPRVLDGFHPSGAGRGLFATSEQAVTLKDDRPIDTREGPAAIIIADGKADPWVRGRDSIDASSPAENKGNYGVIYRVNLRYASSDGKRMAVVMAGHRPDNKWCRNTAAVVEVGEGLSARGVITLPRQGVRFEALPQAALIQTFPAVPPGEVGEIALTYSPPGACCLPTPILLIPF